jgi:hypothetical protein
MMKKLVPFAIALLLLAAVPAHSAEQFTTAEKAEAAKIVRAIESECGRAMSRLSDEGSPNAPEFVKRYAAEFSKERICSCSIQNIEAGLTPAMLRDKKGDQLEKLVVSSAETCALQIFQSAFPPYCVGLFGEIEKVAGTEIPASEQEKVCGCMEPKVRLLKSSDLAGFIGRSKLEFAEYRGSKTFPPASSKTFLGYFVSCGMAEVINSVKSGIVQKDAASNAVK